MKNKTMKNNSYKLDIIVYAQTLKANYAFYALVKKDGHLFQHVCYDLYAAADYIASYGFDKKRIIPDFINSLQTKHSNDQKLAGFYSINTYCGLNDRCKARHDSNTGICGKCYSFRLTAIYDSLQKKLIKATFLYNTVLLNEKDFPVINNKYERIESFGDINTVIQARNYIRFMNRNKKTIFGIFSKNPDLWYKAFIKENGKPANCIYTHSSLYMNKPEYDIFGKYILPDGKDMIDKLFTVYTAAFAIENNVIITCGGNACMPCIRCYNKKGSCKIQNEILKSQLNKYEKLLKEKKQRINEKKKARA